MRRTFLPCGLILLFASPGVAADRPTPREIIERAIAAHGGKEMLSRPLALHFEVVIKGCIPLLANPDDSITHVYLYSGREGEELFRKNALDPPGDDIIVLAGDRVREGTPEKVKANHPEDPLLNRMSWLQHLLEDPAFTLTPLLEARVDGQPAYRIKATCKGDPDVYSLYFDVKTGLLAQTSLVKNYLTVKGRWEVEHRIVFSDHRDPGDPTIDATTLRAVGVSVKPEELMTYLRKQSPTAKGRKRVCQLVGQLGADTFVERERAQKELLALGGVALPALRKAAKDTDLELSRRARECIERLEARSDRERVRAALRLLVHKAAPGTARALLDLLPGAEEFVAEEILAALAHLAEGKGPEEKALEAALDDKDPVKKAAAQAVLGKDGCKYLARPGRPLYPSGFKYPMRQTCYSGNTKLLEFKIVRIDYYNALDEKVFVRPK